MMGADEDELAAASVELPETHLPDDEYARWQAGARRGGLLRGVWVWVALVSIAAFLAVVLSGRG